MQAQPVPTLMTADELLQVDIPGKWTELVRGRLVVREPPGTYHGVVAANVAYFISDFVRRHELGVVCGQDTGFKIASDPDTVRAPDVAFVRKENVRLIGNSGYAALAPDLVAEVVSPSDRPGELLAKAGDWLEAGVHLVWVIDPDRGEARVHRADGSLQVIGADGALDGEEMLPGFTCALSRMLTP